MYWIGSKGRKLVRLLNSLFIRPKNLGSLPFEGWSFRGRSWDKSDRDFESEWAEESSDLADSHDVNERFSCFGLTSMNAAGTSWVLRVTMARIKVGVYFWWKGTKCWACLVTGWLRLWNAVFYSRIWCVQVKFSLHVGGNMLCGDWFKGSALDGRHNMHHDEILGE